MRYAIFSDLHANRQALNAVLTDIRVTGADRLICLGDFVGYGPAPAETLEIAYTRIDHFVLGNHDAVIAERLSSDCFRDEAKRIIDWTAGQLDSSSYELFNRLPLVLRDDCFSCAHAEFSAPAVFNYIFDDSAALTSFNAAAEQLLFTGHSHVPGLFVLGASGVPHWLEPLDFGLEEGKRYLVNVGSVGQPRDNDVRASYVIFDTEENSLFFRKVPFDIDAYLEELLKAGLPAASGSTFIHLDQSLRRRPLREMISFKPPEEREVAVAENDIQDLRTNLGKLKKSNRRLAMLSAALAALAVLAVFMFVRGTPPIVLEAAEDPALVVEAEQASWSALGREPGTLLLTMPGVPANGGEGIFEDPKRQLVSPDFRLQNWSVRVEDPESQEVVLTWEGEEVRFLITSGNPEKTVKLYSPPVSVEKGQRVQVRATFFNQAVRQGYAEIFSEYTAPDGSVRRLNTSTIHDLTELGRWSPRAATCAEFAAEGTVRYVLRARLEGELLVRDCAMVLR